MLRVRTVAASVVLAAAASFPLAGVSIAQDRDYSDFASQKNSVYSAAVEQAQFGYQADRIASTDVHQGNQGPDGPDNHGPGRDSHGPDNRGPGGPDNHGPDNHGFHNDSHGPDNNFCGPCENKGLKLPPPLPPVPSPSIAAPTSIKVVPTTPAAAPQVKAVPLGPVNAGDGSSGNDVDYRVLGGLILMAAGGSVFVAKRRARHGNAN